jgi:hypothetical protein
VSDGYRSHFPSRMNSYSSYNFGSEPSSFDLGTFECDDIFRALGEGTGSFPPFIIINVPCFPESFFLP